MIGNGDFENVSTTCLYSSPANSALFDNSVSCWKRVSNTPDLFGRNCATFTNIPTTSFYTDVPFDTWNNDLININHFIGLYGKQLYNWNTGFWEPQGFEEEEAVQTTLTLPIIAGHTYTLTFRAMLGDGTIGNPYSSPIAICGATSEQTYQTSNFNISSWTQLGSYEYINNETWTLFSHTFTYNSGPNLSQLIIGLDVSENIGLFPSGVQYVQYVMLDDLHLQEALTPPTLDIPNNALCTNNSYSNLAQYLSNSNFIGGIFSGAGISLVNNQYQFNASVAGPGNHTITYTYKSINFCFTITDQIYVAPLVFLSGLVTNVACPCTNNGAINLTAANGTQPLGYLWSASNLSCPGFSTATTQDLINLNSGAYTVVVTDNYGCQAQATYQVQLNQETPNYTSDLVISGVYGPISGTTLLFDADLRQLPKTHC